VKAIQARLLEWRKADQKDETWATAVAFRRLMRLSPEQAAAEGCAVLGEGTKEPRGMATAPSERLAAAALAVALTKVPCPGLEALMAENPCDPALRCDPREQEKKQILGGLFAAVDPGRNPICEQDELEAELDVLREKSILQGAKGLTAARLALLRAHRQGTLPAGFEERHERRRYILDDAQEERCESKHPERKRCKCPEQQVRQAVCEAKPDQRKVTFEACAIEIDDDAGKLRTSVIRK
jgi:hypothetical protein